MKFELRSVGGGNVVDTISVTGDAVEYATGSATSIVESAARRRKVTAAKAAAGLDGWSNGYLTVAAVKGSSPVAATEFVQLLNESLSVAAQPTASPANSLAAGPLALSRMPAQLRKYWLTHEAWAAPGAFASCQKDLRAHGVPGHMVDGACANLHHEATGEWPGHHNHAPLVLNAAEVRTGAMVALVPSKADAARLAVDGGEDEAELHVTLIYLGKAADIPEDVQHQLIEALKSTVEDAIRPDYDLPLVADGFAVSVFNPGDTNDRDTCIVLGLSGGELSGIHSLVTETVEEVGGFDLPEQHLPWIPHLTLTYTDDVKQVAELTDRVGPVTFDRLRVAFAGEVTDIPLTPVTTVALNAVSRPGAGFFGLVAASQQRLHAKLNPNQLHDPNTGRWMEMPDLPGVDDDDDDEVGPAELSLIRNERVGTSADYNVAVMTDKNGTYGPKGSRVIGIAAETGRKDWENDGLEDEAWDIPEKDADAVATALESMSRQAAAHDGTEGSGPRLLGSTEAGGYHFAAIHDAYGDGSAFVAMTYARHTDMDWGDLQSENQDYEGFSPEDAADIAKAVRSLRTAGARERTADPKLDKAKLDGRIDLAPGQKLVGSQKLRVDDGNEAVLASIATPSGPALAVIPADEDFRRWEGEPSLLLSGTELAQFRQNVAALPQRRKDALKKLEADYGAAFDAGWMDFEYSSEWGDPSDIEGGAFEWPDGMTREQKLETLRLHEVVNGDVLERGVLASGPWGELVYELDGPGIDGDDDSFELDASRAGLAIGVKQLGSDADWSVSDAMWREDGGIGFDFDRLQMAKFVKAVEEQSRLAEGGGA